jgi:hypothetical protein
VSESLGAASGMHLLQQRTPISSLGKQLACSNTALAYFHPHLVCQQTGGTSELCSVDTCHTPDAQFKMYRHWSAVARSGLTVGWCSNSEIASFSSKTLMRLIPSLHWCAISSRKLSALLLTSKRRHSSVRVTKGVSETYLSTTEDAHLPKREIFNKSTPRAAKCLAPDTLRLCPPKALRPRLSTSGHPNDFPTHSNVATTFL